MSEDEFLGGGDDFTVIEHATELWKGGKPSSRRESAGGADGSCTQRNRSTLGGLLRRAVAARRGGWFR